MERTLERLSLQRIVCKAGKRCLKALRKLSRRRPVSPMETVEADAPPADAAPANVTPAAAENRAQSEDECGYDSYDEISLMTVDTWVAGDEAVDNQLNEALEKKMASL